MRQFDADDGSMKRIREENQNDRHVLASLLLLGLVTRRVRCMSYASLSKRMCIRAQVPINHNYFAECGAIIVVVRRNDLAVGVSLMRAMHKLGRMQKRRQYAGDNNEPSTARWNYHEGGFIELWKVPIGYIAFRRLSRDSRKIINYFHSAWPRDRK